MRSLHALVKMRGGTNLPEEGVIPVSTSVVPAATDTLKFCRTSSETRHWDKVQAACVIHLTAVAASLGILDVPTDSFSVTSPKSLSSGNFST